MRRRVLPPLALAACAAALAAVVTGAASAARTSPAAGSVPAALARAASATERVPGYTFQFATLTTGPSLSTPIHYVTTGTLRGGTTPFADVQVDMGQKVRNSAGNYEPGRYRVIATGTAGTERLLVTGVVFERALTRGLPWGSIDSASLKKKGIFARDRLIPGADAAAYITLLRIPGTKLKVVEQVKSKGVSATHYKVTVDVAALVNGAGVGKAAADHLQFLYPSELKTDTYDAWIDANGVLRQLLFVFPVGPPASKATYRLDVSLTPLRTAPQLELPDSALIEDITSLYLPKKG